MLTKEQARQWAIGSWILDYGAKLEHARSDEERTALESERRDRIASLELRADGTFTTSNRLANSPTDTTMVGKWTVKFPYELAGESETGEMLRFSLQPNGFLLQLTATETGYKEDYWKKIR